MRKPAETFKHAGDAARPGGCARPTLCGEALPVGERHADCPFVRRTPNSGAWRKFMAGKQMEGNNEQRRAAAKKARDAGTSASEIGASTGASQQRAKADGKASHQEKLDLKRQGKQDVIRENTPEARPGSRDADTLDRERHPRL
jgi:hypothetical protein